ncbi:RNA-binding domain-containing protein [Mucilaginibacter angelicae]|uniref:RNA-binding domain-containing protein n=1 Tax=Mucilaginibacter angelicae TaxID=869718 RepID=A0ABV6L5I3_9SPHI
MALPIDIDGLINVRTVESVRIEFKKGWNPYSILKSVCAFANDIDEYGGGFIVIGIEEKDGSPILPPTGLSQNAIDTIQREFFKLCQDDLKENLFPVIEPIYFQDKWIVVIRVTTGEQRPYYAADSAGRNARMKMFVRHGAITKEANRDQEIRLRELAVHKHFDDRVNLKASIGDIDIGLILAYLQDINSQLFTEAHGMSLEDLCLKMQIIRGPKENLKPLNVGLLLFNKQPETFFAGCVTNLVEFDDEAGTQISEKQFKGPIHIQIRNILEYLNTAVIKQYLKKDASRAESIRFYNYPYAALEEAIVNALYHRSYENENPNEIRIYKQPAKHQTGFVTNDGRRIEILSYPGPLPPIDENALAALKITARNYRNVKLGDWLKNIKLAEKFATGIPTIVDALYDNGSPRPLLSTDAERSHFLVVFHIHPDTPVESKKDVAEFIPIHLTNMQQRLLEKLMDEPLSDAELFSAVDGLNKDDIDYLLAQILIRTKYKSSEYIYFITETGRLALKNSF